MSEMIYGFHSVEHAIDADPGQVLGIWVSSQRHDQRLERVLAKIRRIDIPVEYGDADQISKLCGTSKHQGIAARVRRSAGWSEQRLISLLEALQSPALLLVLDGVTDPRNLGACMRTAEAAGAHAVIVPKDRSAQLVPAARKTAAGAAERLPFVAVSNLARFLRKIQDLGVWIVGTAADAETGLYQARLTQSIALVLGGEGGGLRRLTREHCDQMVNLPMAGEVESLNVSVAAGICLYEARRQRLALGG